MVDEKKRVSFSDGQGQDHQNASPQAGVTEPGKGTEPKYVTLEEAKRLAEEAAEERFRRAQSLTDKYNSQLQSAVKTRVDEVLRSYKLLNPGQELSQEQLEQVRQRAINEVLSGDNIQGSQAPGTPPSGSEQRVPDDVEIQFVERRVGQIEAQLGVEIREGDEEEKLLNWNTPEAFIQSYTQAATAKAKRLGIITAEPTFPGAGPAAAPALVAGSGSGNNLINMTKPDDLWNEAKRRNRI